MVGAPVFTGGGGYAPDAGGALGGREKLGAAGWAAPYAFMGAGRGNAPVCGGIDIVGAGMG